MSTGILWLRRDLRLRDHPALVAAAGAHEELVVVFCLDPRLLGGRHASAARTRFMLECLRDLDGQLRGRGGGLTALRGVPEVELPRLARRLGACAVHATADVGPYATRRDAAARAALAVVGAPLSLHPGLFAVADPAAIRSRTGEPYTIFTPYHRAWLAQARRPPLAPPSSLPPPPARTPLEPVPGPEDLAPGRPLENPAVGGETSGLERLERFLGDGLERYEVDRDALGADATSRLSAYLHFGCLSPREIECRLPDGEGAEAFHRQLCWREFYANVLQNHPRNTRLAHQRRYRSLRWSRSRGAFQAWCEGRTGYPIVDAAMRQLLREGWMHNRGRLICGSFLTKHLGIDWRWGERWFMRHLIDGDEANNNGNWQWIASVGVDPQPVYRRLYNPVLQQERHDPDGAYVRRHLPELARVPDAYLAKPWTMPAEVQRQAGCTIGADYPAPIVQHAEARAQALARYAEAR